VIEEIRRIANQHLTPDKMTLVVVGDEKTVKRQVTGAAMIQAIEE